MEINAANATELIAAIHAANDAPEETHIINLTGTDNDYVLIDLIEEWFGWNGLPVVTSDITIYGNGRLITRATKAPAFRFFCVNGKGEHPQARLVLNDLTLANGDSLWMGGGAIVNDGILMVNNCVLRDNHGTNGGAIYAGDAPPTTISNSAFIYNIATLQGGAVFGAITCQLDVKNSLFYENFSPSGASHIFESGTNTTRIEDCFTWNGETFTQIDQIPDSTATIPTDAAQTLLRQAILDTQRITDLRADVRHQRPATRYGKPLPPAPWWRNYVPVPMFESLIGQAEMEQSVPAMSIERLIFSGQFQAVHDLAVAVSARENALRTNMELMSEMFNLIHIRLAYMPGVASIEALLRLAEFSTWEKAAGVAAWVAHAKTQATVIEFFDRNGEMFQTIIEAQRNKHTHSSQLEFLVALIQEMVLRGLDGESVLSIKSLIEKLQKSYRYVGAISSLRDLPLVRLELEENLSSISSEQRFINPAGEDFDTFDAKMPITSDVPPFKDITPYHEDETIGAAVAFFSKEARVYQFEAPLTPGQVTLALLLSLDLKLLQNISHMNIRHIEPKAALEHLSCYSNDHRIEPSTPAYRRLKIWKSIAGLVGVPGEDKLSKLQDIAKTCQWFYLWGNYEGNSDLKGLCLAVLRPDGHTLAVLISLVPADY